MENYSFSKVESTQLKGFAVLCMVYLHLFNRMDEIQLCDALYIGNYSVDFYLSRLTNPVPMFVILSGIGLYICHREAKEHNIKRALKLFRYYWLTLLVFLPLSLFCSDDKLNYSPLNFILNILGLRTNYNYEAWFLFPYVLVSIASPLLFKYLDAQPKKCLVFSATLSVLATGVSFMLGIRLYNIVAVFHIYYFLKFQFVLILGACLIKYDIATKMKLHYGGAILLFLCLAVAMILFNNGIINVLYSLSVIILVKLFLPFLPGIVTKMLYEAGKASTFIWLTHTWIAFHFFKDFIYGFKIPILIFIVLALFSFFLSKIFMQVSKILKI